MGTFQVTTDKRANKDISKIYSFQSLPSTHSGANNPSGRDTKIEGGAFQALEPKPSLLSAQRHLKEAHPARVQACPVLVGGRGAWESQAAGHAGMRRAHTWRHTLLGVVSDLVRDGRVQ